MHLLGPKISKELLVFLNYHLSEFGDSLEFVGSWDRKVFIQCILEKSH